MADLLLEFMADAERVFDHHGFQIIETAFQILEPYGGPLQAVRCANVEHEKAVDELDERRIIEPCGEEVGMARTHTAIAANV